MIKDALGIEVDGHLTISSRLADGTGEKVLLRKRNAVHRENMSLALARSLAAKDSGPVYLMCFGRGGATVDELGQIDYATPNTTGAADLNDQTFSKVVDAARGASEGNDMSVRHVTGTLFSDVEIRCLVGKDEPSGQAAFDNASTDLDGNFVFDEIGLKTDDGLLLTHVVFSPIEKSANRVLEIVYQLRITLAS